MVTREEVLEALNEVVVVLRGVELKGRIVSVEQRGFYLLVTEHLPKEAIFIDNGDVRHIRKI